MDEDLDLLADLYSLFEPRRLQPTNPYTFNFPTPEEYRNSIMTMETNPDLFSGIQLRNRLAPNTTANALYNNADYIQAPYDEYRGSWEIPEETLADIY